MLIHVIILVIITSTVVYFSALSIHQVYLCIIFIRLLCSGCNSVSSDDFLEELDFAGRDMTDAFARCVVLVHCKCYLFQRARRAVGSSPPNCNSGNVAVAFALTIGILILMISCALDLARWWEARSRVLAAVDGAVLAGARSLQVDRDRSDVAIQIAQQFYQENLGTLSLAEDLISFRTGENGSSMVAEGTAFITTPWLTILGVSRLPLTAYSQAQLAIARVAAGRNSATEIEVALVLDISASMTVQKLHALKQAANDLVDIVVWDDQSSRSARAALVPFADAIRIEDRAMVSSISIPAPTRLRFTDRTGMRRTWPRDYGCVSERTGAAAFTDDPPAGANLVGVYFGSDGTCEPTAGAVVPLTSDKVLLKQAIDRLVSGGDTAGHLGVAWAWYVLSPRWSQQWPAASQPLAYDLLHQHSAEGAPRLRKIVILMTDGDFTTAYCSGVADETINCNATNGPSAVQARALCSNMKAAGVEIFSVGFELPSGGDAAATLQECASQPSMLFLADDIDALRQAYRDIALRISKIYMAL